MQNNEIGPLSHTIAKITSKWIKNSHVRPKNIELLGGKIGQRLYNIGLAMIS